MRFTTMSGMTLQAAEGHPLDFAGPRGERLLVSVLEQDMVRVRFLPDGKPRQTRTWAVVGPDGVMPREGRQRDDLTPFSCPAVEHETTPDALTVRTEALTLRIQPDTAQIEWQTADGKPFATDRMNGAYGYDRAGRLVRHYLARQMDEHYYGFGEAAGPLDKAGMRLRLDATDALAYDAQTSDPLYKHWPFYITYVPDRDVAYGLFYDNPAEGVFDLGREINGIHGPYRYYEGADGDIDYTLIYGPSIEAVVAKFVRLIGLPNLPPRWSLGYLGSTMFYTEMPDADAQLQTFIDLCATHDIPCEMFHLSSGYTTDDRGRRKVFTWNRDKIADPAAMVTRFHDAGIKLSANIKPHLLRSHPEYDAVKALGAFVRAADEDSPEVVPYWSGGIAETEDASYLDFTNPVAYDWWQERLTATLLDYGIDVPWNDNNEWEIRDSAARCAGYGDGLPIGLARATQVVLMAQASFEAVQAANPADRPYVLTRSGAPGVQRYAQTWSGDNASTWHTLRYNTPMGLSLSLSGLANCGHDVGGFIGDAPSADLLLRWVQKAIFEPRFTIHSVGLAGLATEPWMYPDILPLVRDAIRFRYRLIPTLYTLLAESAQTGAPIIRPLVYHFARDPRCRTESFDFMLGPNLLVAPVMEGGAATRAVYLPAGTAWCDFYSCMWYEGGQVVTLDAPQTHIPLLVRGGGLVPLAPETTNPVVDADSREVHAFPTVGGGTRSFTLVEDDGVSIAYRSGGQTRVTLRMTVTPMTIELGIDAPVGDYPLPYNTIDFILPPGESRPVVGGVETIDGDGRRRIRVAVPQD